MMVGSGTLIQISKSMGTAFLAAGISYFQERSDV